MRCPKCGNEVNEGMLFCTKCGARLSNNNIDYEGNPLPHRSRQSSSKQSYTPIYIAVSITVVGFLMCIAIVLASSSNNNKEVVYDDETTTTVETETEPVTQVEIVTQVEVVTEVVTVPVATPAPAAQAVTPPPTQQNNYTDEIYSLISGAYSIGWVQATNTHNASYLLPYTTADTQAYSILGAQYWQQKPNVSFNYINNVQIYNIVQLSEWDYQVYVSYDYELYNASTGKVTSKTELTIDEVHSTGGEFILQSHNWKNDLPLGSYVSLSSFQ